MVRTRKTVFGNPALDHGPVPANAKTLAYASLVCWFGAIVAGRLIAYVGSRRRALRRSLKRAAWGRPFGPSFSLPTRPT